MHEALRSVVVRRSGSVRSRALVCARRMARVAGSCLPREWPRPGGGRGWITAERARTRGVAACPGIHGWKGQGRAALPQGRAVRIEGLAAGGVRRRLACGVGHARSSVAPTTGTRKAAPVAGLAPQARVRRTGRARSRARRTPCRSTMCDRPEGSGLIGFPRSRPAAAHPPRQLPRHAPLPAASHAPLWSPRRTPLVRSSDGSRSESRLRVPRAS
jgi:hypothetical protein